MSSGAGRPYQASGRPDQRVAILEATVRCIARWGVTKTTLDDVANEAGCSRATVYRVVPGGKQALLAAAGEREMALTLEAVAAALDEASDLEELLTAGIHTAAEAMAGHPALGYLMAHEPSIVLPHLAFDELAPLLETASGFAVPWLQRYMSPDLAAEVGEWAARIVVAYGTDPDPAVDLTDQDAVRSLVRGHLLAGIATARDHVTMEAL